MKESIAKRANELINNMESMKITKSLDNDNLQCRVQWDENGKIVCVAEQKVVEGLTPDDYKYFFENW